jgi:hypothetical protein
MAIESDVRGADALLTVKFYRKPIEIKDETIAQGRPIFRDADWVTIYTPGDQLNIIDTIAQDRHKSRFPVQWAKYQNSINGDEGISGTPIDQWTLVSKSQAEELKGIKFHTVEAVANCSDQQLQRIGMIAGMSPHAFREKAKAFLNLANDTAEIEKRNAELAQLKEENAKIRAETDARIAEMQAKFDSQMATLLAAVKEKTPKTRKQKVDAEA